jgi:putative hydrolase of the HAD superfamily
MMITAVTIDFWNTIVDSGNGALRRARRDEAMRRACAEAQRPWDERAVRSAIDGSYRVFEQRWHGEQRTMTAAECLDVVWKLLDMSVSPGMHEWVTAEFEDSILTGMPDLLPGAATTLAALATGHRLALISDTAFSPGVKLRAVLEHHGVLPYFTALVFSDEVGVSKPHPRTFGTALAALQAAPADAVHIGDLERTDIAGARAAGMRSILFTGDRTARYHDPDAHGDTAADAVAQSWDEVAIIIARWNAASDEDGATP